MNCYLINKPFINIKPGYTILKYCKSRNWTQEYLSQITNIPVIELKSIIDGKMKISATTAESLANVFKTSPEFWINLETTYRTNLNNGIGA